MSQRSRSPLPWTCSSRPGAALSSRTAASTSPERTWVPRQVGSVSVVEGTCLGSALRPWETGSPRSLNGQYPAQMSYVRRPSRKASARA